MDLFKLIHLILLAISEAIFNFWFLFVLWLVFFIISKMRRINLYTLDLTYSRFSMWIESVFQGMVVGIAGSLMIIFLGLPIHMSIYLALLLPISILLALINMRYVCISYSASILGLLSLIFKGQIVFGLELPNIDINIFGLMALVGVFHMMESILVFFFGSAHAIPIVTKKDNQVFMGYMMQKVWPIPFAMLIFVLGEVIEGGIEMPLWWPALKPTGAIAAALFCSVAPMVGLLGYRSISYTDKPEVRARRSGVILFLYSSMLILMTIVVKETTLTAILGILLMVGLHEGIILLEQLIERKKHPIYTIPSKGVRILHVTEGGLAEKAGIKIGSIISKVNGEELLDTKHLKAIIEKGLNFLWLETISLEHKVATHEIIAYPAELEKIGLRLVPENPRFIFQYEQLQNIGILNFIKRRR